MIRNKSIVVSAVGNWGALFATIVVSLFLTPFLVHGLGSEHFGVWTLLASVMGVFGLLELGVTSAISRYVAYYIGKNDEESLGSVFSTSLVFFIFVGALCVLGALLASRPLCAFFRVPERLEADFLVAIAVLACSMAISFVSNVFLATLTSHEFFLPGNIVKFASEILRGLLSVAVVRAGAGIRGLALVSLSVSAMAALSHLAFMRSLMPAVGFRLSAARPRMLARLIAYGIPAAVTVIAELLRSGLDSTVIGRYLPLEAVTTYSIGSRLTTFLIQFMVSISGVLDPRFARLAGSEEKETLQRMFLDAMAILTSMSSIIGLALIWEGQALIRLWVGEGFDDAYSVLVILTAGHILAAAQMPSISLLFAMNKHRFPALFAVLEGSMNLGLSVLFVGRWGIKGVAIGTLIPMVLFKALVLPIYTSRVTGIDLGRIMSRFLRPAAAAGAPGLLLIFLARPTSVGWPAFFVLGLVFIGGMAIWTNYAGLGAGHRLDLRPKSIVASLKRPAGMAKDARIGEVTKH